MSAGARTAASWPVPPWLGAAAWAAAAAGTLGLMLSATAGPFASLGAAAFLAAWGLVALAAGPRLIGAALAPPAPLLLLLPVLALLSALWSPAPLATVRGGVQLLLTAGAGILAARLLPPRALVGAVAAALAVAALLCVVFGRNVPDPYSGTNPFVGIFASKNTMAFFMAVLTLFALGAALDGRQRAPVRLAGAAGLALALPLLAMARSVGAVVAVGAAAGVFLLLLALGRARAGERAVLFVSCLVLLLPALALAAGLAAQGALGAAFADLVVGVLGKDLTLTGRTELWAVALERIAERPWLGHGYLGFWREGNPWAEALWREFHVQGRTGFHFHNAPIQAAVDLGVAGAALAAGLLVLAAWGAARAALREPSVPRAALAAVAACLLARAGVEVDALFPFGFGTFLLFAVAASARARPAARRSRSAPAVPAGLPAPGR